MGSVVVDLASCVRCAACAILAPRVFEVTRKGTRVRDGAPAPEDRAAVAAAVLACPAQAIREAGA